MEHESPFSSAGFALLRAPAHAARRAADTHVDVRDGSPEEPERLVEFMCRLADDSELREAVAVSSRPLARQWDAIIAGTRIFGVTQLRRTARSLTAYRLRMATRPTPFGLMAGVAVAEFADEPEESTARIGTRHRRAARPELGWLLALVSEWERRPEVLRGLRVTVNNLCFTRGGRLVLPYVCHAPSDGGKADSGGKADAGAGEVSVRHTAPVREAVKRAQSPVRCGELCDALMRTFPQATRAVIERMLVGLIEREILLTELRPPMDATDPLGHVLRTLAGTEPTAALPELAELQAVARDLDAYMASPAGEGRAAWDQVTRRMARLRKDDRLVQVDLSLDADVRLPPSVAAETERVAHLLWRLSPEASAQSAEVAYHGEFLERFGTGQAVPVREVLDPDAGLGAPYGYRHPPSHRSSPPRQEPDVGRNRLLLALAQDTLMSGAPEAVLDDDHPLVTGIARDTGTPPASLEMFTELLADSPAALKAGDFRLVVSQGGYSRGATFGRFTHLLPDRTRSALAAFAATPSDGRELCAQVLYRTSKGRGANVAQTPRLLDHEIPVAVYADRTASGILDLDDIGVRADLEQLWLVRLSDGSTILPTSLHWLDVRAYAPNTARFLCAAGRGWGHRSWQPWDWGAASDLPHTPRVRYGRSILVPARWRAPASVLDEDAPFERWAREVARWRELSRVPDRLMLSFADQAMELDLTQPQHLRLFRHELGRRPRSELSEVLAPSGTDSGWLRGSGGAHRAQLVFPLARRTRQPPAPARGPERTVRIRDDRPEGPAEHLPGGEWLYASVYCATERHNDLLISHLPRLTAALPPEVDRWFFIRYRDPDPVLRLRFHSSSQALRESVLPGLHAWAADLRAHRLIRRLSLDTYEPELARYGGPGAIDTAERAFHADSQAAIDVLTLMESGRLTLEPVLVAALGYVDLLRRFHDSADARDGAEPSWIDGLLRAFPKGEKHGEFQSRRREALDVINPYDHQAPPSSYPGADALAAVWERRSAALTDYGRTLRGLGTGSWTAPQDVWPSLFHMHHNRLLGIDPGTEAASLAIARGAVQAHRDRRHNADRPRSRPAVAATGRSTDGPRN